jgi:hypothetical protein
MRMAKVRTSKTSADFYFTTQVSFQKTNFFKANAARTTNPTNSVMSVCKTKVLPLAMAEVEKKFYIPDEISWNMPNNSHCKKVHLQI